MITKLDKEKHKYVMLAILLDIYRDFDLGTSFVFKWWTACYFLYNLDRFSTDLDFDFVGEISEQTILEKLKKIVQKYWEIRDFYNKRNTFFLMLSYWEIDHNIKIEISKRITLSKYERIHFNGMDILVQNKSSIFANKLYALTNRTSIANRDLYDIYFFFRNLWDIDEPLLESLTGMKTKDYFKKVIDFIEKLGENYNILNWLWELIDSKQKTFVKEKLLNELIWYIKFRTH